MQLSIIRAVGNGLHRATRLVAEGGITKQRQRQQADVEQQRQQDILQRFHQQRAERHFPDDAQLCAGQRGRDLNAVAVEINSDAVRIVFILPCKRVLAAVWLKAEALKRHARRDQIVNRHVERNHRRQMARLVKRGAQGEIVTVLPGEFAQRREALALIQRVRLLKHLGAARIGDRVNGILFKTGGEIF